MSKYPNKKPGGYNLGQKVEPGTGIPVYNGSSGVNERVIRARDKKAAKVKLDSFDKTLVRDKEQDANWHRIMDGKGDEG